IWQKFFRHLRTEGGAWAATGVLAIDGRIKPVILEPKLRACLQQGGIKHILTPHQGEASTIDSITEASTTAASSKETPLEGSPPRIRLGFAAERAQLQVHRCSHIGRVLLVLGDFVDRQQVARNAFAIIASAIMLLALPDLRSVLSPYPAPVAVQPTSPSPYYLWVSLDTKHPQYFSVVLESDYWSNRRADLKRCGGVTPSIRAEMHFHRLTGMTAANEDDGVVWVERKPRFLTREFFSGERVARYSIPYLTHLGHE